MLAFVALKFVFLAEKSRTRIGGVNGMGFALYKEIYASVILVEDDYYMAKLAAHSPPVGNFSVCVVQGLTKNSFTSSS